MHLTPFSSLSKFEEKNYTCITENKNCKIPQSIEKLFWLFQIMTEFIDNFSLAVIHFHRHVCLGVVDRWPILRTPLLWPPSCWRIHCHLCCLIFPIQNKIFQRFNSLGISDILMKTTNMNNEMELINDSQGKMYFRICCAEPEVIAGVKQKRAPERQIWKAGSARDSKCPQR